MKSQNDLDLEAAYKATTETIGEPWSLELIQTACLKAIEYARTPKEPVKSDLEAALEYSGYNTKALCERLNLTAYDQYVGFLAGIAHRDQCEKSSGPTICVNKQYLEQLKEKAFGSDQSVEDLYFAAKRIERELQSDISNIQVSLHRDLHEALQKFESRGSNEK